MFQQTNEKFAEVFEDRQHVSNDYLGNFCGIVNMGPQQRKGCVHQYAKDKLNELQAKCDTLEQDGVLAKPELAGVTVEYLSPSFLVKKGSGGYRLVTAFGDIGRHCLPQPGLKPNVDAILRLIAQWRYLISTDLSAAFYQIKLSKESMKYCGMVTPFKGVRVYQRCAMGLPGSEVALEELLCRLLGSRRCRQTR